MSSYFSLPMYASSIDQRLRLVAGRCTQCGQLAYPQRTQCSQCGHAGFDDVPLSGHGHIFSFTVIARGGAPAEFDDQQTMTGRLACAIVELAEGPRVIGQLAGWDGTDLAIGMAVRAVTRRLFDQEGIVRYGTKFMPVAGGGQ